MYQLARVFFGLYILFTKYICTSQGKTIFGREHIPKNGPYIVVANHIGDSDPWWIGIQFPLTVHWWAKKELCSFSLAYAELRHKKFSVVVAAIIAFITVVIVKYSSVIPVDRTATDIAMNRAAFKESLHLLRRGGVVGIFVQGGTAHELAIHDEDSQIKRSCISLARQIGCPIIPVFIGRKRVVIGEAISFGIKSDKDFVLESAVSVIRNRICCLAGTT